MEYYYGEFVDDKDSQDLIAVMRKMSPEGRKFVNVRQEVEGFPGNKQQIPESGKSKKREPKHSISVGIIPFSNRINEITSLLSMMLEKVDEEIEIQNID